MADTEQVAPPLKRRKVNSDDENEERSSPDRAFHSPTRRLAIRDRDIRQRSQSHDRDYAHSRSRSPRSRTRSLSRTQSPASRSRSTSSRSRGRRSTTNDGDDDDDDESRSRSGRYYSSDRTDSRSRRSTTDSRSRTTSSRRRRRPHSSTRSPSGSLPRTPSPPELLEPEPIPHPNFLPCLSLHGHTGPVSQVRLSPDGRWIASASADGTARIWDSATGAHMETLVGHMAGINTVAWAPDSAVLATGSDDKKIRCWDRRTGRPAHSVARQLVGHHSYVYCLAFSPQGNVLASGSYDEAVFLWDVRGGRILRDLPAHSDPVSGIDFSPDGTLVCSCSTDGLIRIWDTSTGQCLRTLVHEDNPPISSVCFSPNGRHVLASSLDSSIRLWDYIEGRGTVKRTYQGHASKKFAVGGCFCNTGEHDQSAIASIGSGGRATDEKRVIPDAGGGGEDDADLPRVHDAGASYVVSASEDGDLVLWDVKSKGVVQRVRKAHSGVCFWVDVKGDTMVTAGQDLCIKVFRNGNAAVRDRDRDRMEEDVVRANGAVVPPGGLRVSPPLDPEMMDADPASGAPRAAGTAAESNDMVVVVDAAAAAAAHGPTPDPVVKMEETQ
ncbi:hypothetical protein MKZ38_001915 [Zalerion maritima]|uniref:WDR5-like beta-propeller domain-containing protein n=1 Tax=Zalerion maritima TaxID=339359 RepID=A0AAD5WR60_9PEZI|nr:hypothetical protein MKZ38_001915 [Zalerion maritima]